MITRKIKIGNFVYSPSHSIQNIAHHTQSLFDGVTSEGGLHVLLCDTALFSYYRFFICIDFLALLKIQNHGILVLTLSVINFAFPLRQRNYQRCEVAVNVNINKTELASQDSPVGKSKRSDV